VELPCLGILALKDGGRGGQAREYYETWGLYGFAGLDVIYAAGEDETAVKRGAAIGKGR
jgi:hypothetical protein